MEFETSNLNFAAACVSYGATVSRTEELGGKKISFFLDNCPKVVILIIQEKIEERDVVSFSDLQHLFSSGCLMLRPGFPGAIKSLKTLIYDRKNN